MGASWVGRRKLHSRRLKYLLRAAIMGSLAILLSGTLVPAIPRHLPASALSKVTGNVIAKTLVGA